jgi:hypothetical protein
MVLVRRDDRRGARRTAPSTPSRALACGFESQRDVLAALAFDFPDTCTLNELAARLVFIANAWESADTVAYVARAHSLDSAALAALYQITHRDVLDLLE